MPIATSAAAVVELWPEGVPRDNKELYDLYSQFVAAALRRHNKVRRNFDEMYSFVWQRLFEKDIVTLFMQSVQEKLPKQISALQACKFLGISFEQWRVKMWRFHVGVPIKSKYDPKRIIGRRQRGWMPTPINADGFLLKSRERNAKRVARGEQPEPETKGHRSVNALFDIDDIVTLSVMENLTKKGMVSGPFRKKGEAQFPQMKATKSHFQAYLSKSVYSDWCNWCRTYKRKWSQDRPMFLRADDEQDDSNWETKLVDPSGMKQETEVGLKEAVYLLSETFNEEMREVDPLQCKPVAQTEMQMFELLQRGVPLPEALKKLEIPEKVRRAVLKTVFDIRSHAA
jgi:hypothetical protein